MALTRKMLKAMGIEEEKIEQIIEAHTETTEGLKAERDKYKEDAEKLPGVQNELNELKTAGDGGYKEKYEKEHADFEKYKADQTAKETRQAKETAYRELLKAAGVSEKRIPAILKVTDLNGIEMDGDKIKDADKHTQTVKTEWADFVEKSNTTGASTTTPPANNQTPAAPKTIAEALRAKVNSN